MATFRPADEIVFHSVQRRGANLLAKGVLSHKQVATVLGVSRATVDKWCKDQAFMDLVHEMARDQEQQVADILSDATQHAALMLIEALHAVDNRGRPDWKVRWLAILEALKRDGMAGVLPERTESEQKVITGDLNQALAQALSEPAVREYLESLNPPVPLLGPSDEPPSDTGSTDEGAGTSGATEDGPDAVQEVRGQPYGLLQGSPGSQPVEQTA